MQLPLNNMGLNCTHPLMHIFFSSKYPPSVLHIPWFCRFNNLGSKSVFSICRYRGTVLCVVLGHFMWDSSIHGFWYLHRVLEPIPTDTEGRLGLGSQKIYVEFWLGKGWCPLTPALSKVNCICVLNQHVLYLKLAQYYMSFIAQ